VFTNVELTTGTPAAAGPPAFLSVLETVKVASKDRRAVWSTNKLIEAPIWTHDGAALIFNGKGRLQRIPVAGGEPQLIDTGLADPLRPKPRPFARLGRRLSLATSRRTTFESQLYTVLIEGG